MDKSAALRTDARFSECFSVFIFDWDDTLFPTSALLALGPEQLKASFAQIDTLVLQLLHACIGMARSKVLLLTSANLEWLRHSSHEFLPSVAALLNAPPAKLSVVSSHRKLAKAAIGASSVKSPPEEVARRKLEAVVQAAQLVQADIDGLGAKMVQVMSVGDGPFDLQAAHVLARTLRVESRLVKTIGMKPRPNHLELAGELRCLCRALPALVRVPRAFHQSMAPTPKAAVPSVEPQQEPHEEAPPNPAPPQAEAPPRVPEAASAAEDRAAPQPASCQKRQQPRRRRKRPQKSGDHFCAPPLADCGGAAGAAAADGGHAAQLHSRHEPESSTSGTDGPPAVGSIESLEEVAVTYSLSDGTLCSRRSRAELLGWADAGSPLSIARVQCRATSWTVGSRAPKPWAIAAPCYRGLRGRRNSRRDLG